MSQPLWIEGTVTEAYFGQPHPEVTIRTAATMAPPSRAPDLAGVTNIIGGRSLSIRPETRGREVTIEFPPVSAFFRMGRSVSPGERVAVIAYRNCEAPHQLRGQWIQLAGEAPVARAGRVQYQVEGC